MTNNISMHLFWQFKCCSNTTTTSATFIAKYAQHQHIALHEAQTGNWSELFCESVNITPICLSAEIRNERGNMKNVFQWKTGDYFQALKVSCNEHLLLESATTILPAKWQNVCDDTPCVSPCGLSPGLVCVTTQHSAAKRELNASFPPPPPPPPAPPLLWRGC